MGPLSVVVFYAEFEFSNENRIGAHLGVVLGELLIRVFLGFSIFVHICVIFVIFFEICIRANWIEPNRLRTRTGPNRNWIDPNRGHPDVCSPDTSDHQRYRRGEYFDGTADGQGTFRFSRYWCLRLILKGACAELS